MEWQNKHKDTKKEIKTFYPLEGVIAHGVDSTFWDNDMFNAIFRFRKEEFLYFMDAMKLSGKYILCGKQGKAQYIPADICFMVKLVGRFSKTG